MKKNLLLIIVLITASFSAEAQVTISPGIRGGLNLSRLTDIENNQAKSDFYVGGLVAIKFNKYFTLQPEISYSRQGTKGTYSEYVDFNSGNSYYQLYDTTYDLNYLSFDAIAKFNFNGGGFHILAGPYFDIKTDDNFTFSGDLVDFDMGIIGGVGYSLPNGLTFEARVKQGFVDIYGFEGFIDDYNENGYYDDIILNQVFQLGVSYTFKTK